MAVLIGLGLEPLAGLTHSSNFTFAFVVVTIVVAELAGPVAALATALASALSLDFFLTRPFHHLAIEDKHDAVAFVGLAVCGLIAAAMGSTREQRMARLAEVDAMRVLLGRVVRASGARASEDVVRNVLEECCRALPLIRAAVRDREGHVVASAGDGAATPVPEEILHPDTLAPRSGASVQAPGWVFPLPVGGGRLPLEGTGWLDIWGDGRSASGEARRTLTEVAFVLAQVLRGRPA